MSPGSLAAAAVSVAVVAIHAVIDVAAHASMNVVSACLRVTIRALKHTVVARIGVAGRAHTIRSPVIHGEVRVIESGIQPASGCVAGGAAGRKSSRHMVRIRRCLIVRSVAAVAIGRQRRVVVVHVTVGTSYCGVRPRQREPRVVVVERSRRPRCSAMTNVALLRESRGHVVRVRRSLEILQMTVDASPARQVVVAVGVTLRALHVSMRAGQGPAGGGVVEGRVVPVARVMADLALLRESCGSVIGIRGSLVILQVATGAGGVRDVVVSIHMALTALYAGMRSRQRPTRLRVIVRRRAPADCGMADLALLRNPSRHVIRICRALVVLQMAPDAGGAGETEVPIGVTLLALQLRVSSGQGKPNGIVIEIRRLPGRCRVTHLAGLRNS